MGLVDNPYKPHTSLWMFITLEREEEDHLHFYNTFNTPRLQDIVYTFVLFHAEKGGVFIGPNDLKIRAKKCHIPGFRDTDDTTAIIGRYYRLHIDTRQYHCLTKLGDHALAVTSPNRGGTTTWQH